MIITIKHEYLEQDKIISVPANEAVIPSIGDIIKISFKHNNTLYQDYYVKVIERKWCSDLSGVTLETK